MKFPYLTACLTLVLPSVARPEDSSPANPLTIQPCWPELPAAAVDLFIPPTRPREPFVATANKVFQLDENQQQWAPVYTPAAPATLVLGIQGYARSSSVLYVAHTRGLARTKDGGETWVEADPPEFSLSPGTFTGLAVNPTNRRDAALGTSSRVWFTRDFGESYAALATPAGTSTILQIAYAGGEEPRLVVLTERALLLTPDRGETWTSLPLPTAGARRLIASPNLPSVLVAGAASPWVAYDLSRPGHRRLIGPSDSKPPEHLAVDELGQGLLWMTSGSQVLLAGCQGDRVRSLLSLDSGQPVLLARAHPRAADQLFVVGTTQALLARVDLPATTGPATNLWEPTAFQPGPMEDSPPAGLPPGSQPVLVDVQDTLRRLAANQPPLPQVLDAALAHAGYNPDDIARWKRRARTRNWMPQLRVGTGTRQVPVDDSTIYSYVDRFGIPQNQDLFLPDQSEWMGYVGVTLVWDFPRLLFDPEEADINKEKRYEMKQRNDLIAQVTTLYHERLELLLRQRTRTDGMSLDQRISAAVKLRQKSELLNHLCGAPLFEVDLVRVTEASPQR
jgi:photosystem II stability/assembly factor-like uncharacterized protein